MNRALLVGINKYPGAPLQGCVNDIVDMATLLVHEYGFRRDDVRLLADERATTQGILDRLGWLLNGIRSGDRIVFHYSGHGGQLPTRNPQGEVDKLDECICPVDFDWSDQHAIRDKQFARIFSAIPAGVKFVWISDSCHSGDLDRDMPHNPIVNRAMPMPADIRWRHETAVSKKIAPLGLKKVAKALNLVYFPGCRSDQTSADASFDGRANGAHTYFLLKAIDSLRSAGSYAKIMEEELKHLKKAGYTQSPYLEGDTKQFKNTFLK